MLRSVMIQKAGGPEVLSLGERPRLEPGPHELLVETRAVGVNFMETYQREGVYPVEHPFRVLQSRSVQGELLLIP